MAILIFLTSLGLIGLGGYYATQLDFKVFSTPKDTDEIIVQGTFDEDVTINQAEKKLYRIEDELINRVNNNLESVNYIQTNNQRFFLYIDLTEMSQREVTSTKIVNDLSFDSIPKTDARAEKLSAGPPTPDYQFLIQVYGNKKSKLKNIAGKIKNFLKSRELSGGGKITEVKIDNINNLTKINGKEYAEVKVRLNQPDNTALIIELKEQLEQEFDEDKLKSLGLEKDDISYDQGFQGQTLESFNSATFVLILAIVLLYILLVLQFNSFSLPLLVLLAVPFSFPLLFPALSYFDNPLSFFVLIGIISLTGIVVNNTIMLTDFVKRSRNEGKSIINSISDSVAIRFRPILITTVTTIIALLPLLFSDPFWESMLLTIIFGLISSMILVLIAFPVWYAIIEKVRTVVKQYFKSVF